MTRKSAPKRPHRFTARLERSTNKLWGAHLAVPQEVAAALNGPDHRRVVCRLNAALEYQCALIPHGRGRFVITVNTSLRQKLGLEIGHEARVELTRDESAYGLPVPEELTELFRQDKAGKRLFHALTKGRQRTLLYIVGKPKDPEARAHRAVVILRHLAENDGVINYRRLSAALKDPRTRPPRRQGPRP
jgi:hypothetical protein